MHQSPRRIWLVTDVYPPDCGGSGWSTHALAQVLQDRGHQVSVISVDPGQSGVTRRCFDDIDVTEVGVRAARRSPWRRLGSRDYAYSTLAAYLSRRLAEEPDVDVLHAQHLHSGPPAIDVGRAHGRATVLTVRDYWPVCLHGTSWWGHANCRGCTTVDLSGCMKEYWGWPRPLPRLMVPWAHRRLRSRQDGIRSAHRVLAVSHSVRERIERDVPGARLAVVPNMVNPTLVESAARSASDIGVRTPYLLTAGKLIPTKGFDRLLTALKETGCPVPLLVAGDGPMRPQLEQQARALGLPVSFHGWVSHDQLLRLQRDARAVVLPSAWHEPLSRLVLETMALGVPVIAWASGGTPEMIESGISGWLVTETADLAAAFADMASPDRRREIGAAARSRVDGQYVPDVVYPAVAAAYAAALEEVGRGDR